MAQVECRSKRHGTDLRRFDATQSEPRPFRAAVRTLLLSVTMVMLASAAALALHQQTQPDTTAITPAMVDLGRAIFHGKGTCYAFHDRVDIEPINYVYADGWVYCRTSVGVKLDTMERHRWVAFEVDEVRGL